MQDLLAEGDFVRSLARALVGDAHGADDLVQESWVAALSRRPSGVRDPRPWLARVVRSLAANLRRSDRRRQRREREVALAKATEAPSTADIVAREQVRQRVVTAVLALEEPFRATVLARFYECLDSDEIAAREGIAVATVRSRLKRGLDKLRARLDTAHGGRRSAWVVPLAPLATVRAPASVLTVTAGGALMSTKKVIAAAAVLLIAGLSLWSVLQAPRPEAPAGSVAALPDSSRDPGASARAASDMGTSAGEASSGNVERVRATGDRPRARLRVGFDAGDCPLPSRFTLCIKTGASVARARVSGSSRCEVPVVEWPVRLWCELERETHISEPIDLDRDPGRLVIVPLEAKATLSLCLFDEGTRQPLHGTLHVGELVPSQSGNPDVTFREAVAVEASPEPRPVHFSVACRYDRVVVHSVGYAPVRLDLRSDPGFPWSLAPRRIPMNAGESIAVRVTDERGLPRQGVLVTLQAWGDIVAPAFPSTLAEGGGRVAKLTGGLWDFERTDAHGMCTFSGIGPSVEFMRFGAHHNGQGGRIGAVDRDVMRPWPGTVELILE